MRLRIVPRAARDGVQGILGDELKIRLTAPPVDGQANESLVRFLAKRFGVPRRCVSILAGHTGRAKRVAIEGIDVERARAALAPD